MSPVQFPGSSIELLLHQPLVYGYNPSLWTFLVHGVFLLVEFCVVTQLNQMKTPFFNDHIVRNLVYVIKERRERSALYAPQMKKVNKQE